MKTDSSDVKTSQHALRYLFVGIGITLFNYILFIALANLIIKNNDYLWLSNLIATTTTVIVAYIAHSKITWKERNVTKISIIRFFIWNAMLAIIISPALTQFFSIFTPLYEFAFSITTAMHLPFTYEFVLTTGAFVLTSAVIMVLNFLFYDKFVFPKSIPDATYTYTPELQKTKVSVIVPIYNTEKYLKNCLVSITNQTHRNLEIILVDDGSTDKSSQIADNYAKKDVRIKVVHQKNGGLSSARNTGLKKATGDYITFVDSDDTIELNMIQHMLASLTATKSNIAVCSFKEIYPNNKIAHFNHDHLQQVFTTEKALKAMLKEQGFMVSSTMKLFPTSYFRNIKFPVGKLHEDVSTTYKLFLQAKQIVFIPQEFYQYIHHENSIINKEFDDRKLDLITFTDQMCDVIDQKYPKLKNTTKERRIRARFSILRQIPLNHPQAKSILNYLKTHQNYITKNPEANIKDKFALRLALINPKFFQLAYKLFK